VKEERVNAHQRTRAARLVALGGIGGDAHSVGLIILRRFLLRAGYRVRYLATQNSVSDLCDAALTADAVLVSNMDGHAAYYLRGLRELQRERGVRHRLWYLGGHPSITGDREALLALRGLGFDRVFAGYVEAGTVLASLDRDLGVRPVDRPGVLETTPHAAAVVELGGGLADERDEVLHAWATGPDAAGLEANAATLATRRSLGAAQAVRRHVLIQPRTGVAGVDEQRELFRALRDAGADVLSFQIDSLTRNNAYEELELVLKERIADPERFRGLNGFPLVNHGVHTVRAITEEFHDIPLQVRHSTRDPRLLAEISFAGGVTAFEGGAITYNLPYYRDYPPRASINRWRYVDALAGLYHRRFGIVIDREFFGVLTASLVPPCLAVAVNVLEALLAAEQGVRSVSLGYAEQGNRAQDIGAVRALRRLGRRYLDERGFPHVAVHTVFHQYMGAFPQDEAKSRELLRGSAVTAAPSGVTRVMLKTYVEALRIPSAQDNVASLTLVRDTISAAATEAADRRTVDAEEELTVRESTAIVDAALSAGRGDVGEAVVEAIQRGYLDIPFSPSLWNAGRGLPIRDRDGAVRFAEAGHLPLPPDVREQHRALVAHRLDAERRPVEELVEQDVLRVARGDFERWPLG
jgi:methylaspartate mutase E subunit